MKKVDDFNFHGLTQAYAERQEKFNSVSEAVFSFLTFAFQKCYKNEDLKTEFLLNRKSTEFNMFEIIEKMPNTFSLETISLQGFRIEISMGVNGHFQVTSDTETKYFNEGVLSETDNQYLEHSFYVDYTGSVDDAFSKIVSELVFDKEHIFINKDIAMGYVLKELANKDPNVCDRFKRIFGAPSV